jgi:pullulanase/glycogen debranching enzyme
MTWAATEGLPYPLGVTWSEIDRAYNFAVYSKHATSVRLLLFDDGDYATPRVELSLEPSTNPVASGTAASPKLASGMTRRPGSTGAAARSTLASRGSCES